MSISQPRDWQEPASPRHSSLPKFLLIPLPTRYRSRRHSHKLVDQEPERRCVPAQPQTSAQDPIARPFEPFQHVVRRENVLEPSSSGRNDIDFVIGNLRFALTLCFAPRSAAAESEQFVLRCDVAGYAEEEDDKADERRQG